MAENEVASGAEGPLSRKTVLFSIGASIAVGFAAVAGVIIDNPGEVAPIEALRPALAIIAFSTVAIFALSKFGGAFRSIAVSMPIILFAILKFAGFFGAGEFLGLSQSGALLTAIVGEIVVIALVVYSISKRDAASVAGFLFFVSSVIGGGLTALALLNVSLSGGAADEAAREIIAAAPSQQISSADFPDIIYIVPDRYGEADVLKREFGHDNSAFLAELGARGFYVERGARSNYAKTVASLASSMNMSSLDAVAEAATPQSADRAPLRRMIADNAVQEKLRAAGYRYEHLGSWWQETRHNPHSDVEFYGVNTLWSSLSEFEHALLRTTPLAWIATHGGFVERNECERLKNQLDYLQQARRQDDAPLFLFAHLTLPHDPVTMDASGNCIEHVYYPGFGTRWDDYKAAYAGYVAFLNKRLLEIIDENIAARGGRDLIFVVQADEGPYPKRLHEDLEMNMHDFSDDEIREKFGIINAIYWDAEKYGAPYLTRTPANNWRIILSKISGEEIPLIEDERSLLMRSDKFVYDNRDVTEILDAPRDGVIASN